MNPLPPQVAVATCADVLGADYDDLCLIESLRSRGIGASHVVWDDPGIDWNSYRLVVVRSTWDYCDRHEQFLAWAHRLPNVLNPYPVLRWNTDKRYLKDLARSGLPIIPTCYLEPGDAFVPPRESFVIKPTVSCGAKNTARYLPSDAASARRHIAMLHAEGQTAMVQPYLANIEVRGEISLIFIGGLFSHAICRDPSLKRSGPPEKDAAIPLSVDVYENVRLYKPTGDERALAERVMALLRRISSTLLYARIDLIHDSGQPIILEIELTEPTLFLGKYSEDGIERLTECIIQSLANTEFGVCCR